MATLKAMFKLFDGYSSTINKIDSKTDKATNKILKASGATDKFNQKLRATGASAGAASSGLGGFISAAAALAGSLKGMSIADDFTNTAARLALINDGLQTQAELQDKIFAAAERSRGSYGEMADAVAKLQLLGGDAFGSNNEAIAFTELMQKSFKLGGADTNTQQQAMRQLTQAMASGRLQGDELVSVSEGAPMLYNAIAKYMGLTKGELKELSSTGAVTADIIKNAIFMAGEDINTMFETLPKTFGDYWNDIKRGATKAFRPVIEKVNAFLNTPKFQKFIDSIVGGLNLMAAGADKFIGFIQSNWGIIEPILYGMAGALALITFGILPVMLIQWIALNWPILLIGAAIGLLIYAMVKFGDVTAKIFGYIGGCIGILVALIYNFIAALSNGMTSLRDFVSNIFIELINGIISGINFLINALNKIPGVDIETVEKLDRANTEKLEYMGFGDAWNKGQELGQKFGGSLSGLGGKLAGMIPKPEEDSSGIEKYMKGGALPVTEKNGSVKVDMTEEDLKYLRDIAEREYINKFSTATLAPNIKISFGDVHKEADSDKVVGRIRRILQEEIATAAEGAYK